LSITVNHFNVEIFSSGLLASKWKPHYLRVYDDGTFEIYSDRAAKDYEIKKNLKEIYRYILFDGNIKLAHVSDLPKSTRLNLLIAYPKDHLKEKIKFKWILFNNDADQK
jgi:hypothetical protein